MKPGVRYVDFTPAMVAELVVDGETPEKLIPDVLKSCL